MKILVGKKKKVSCDKSIFYYLNLFEKKKNTAFLKRDVYLGMISKFSEPSKFSWVSLDDFDQLPGLVEKEFW